MRFPTRVFATFALSFWAMSTFDTHAAAEERAVDPATTAAPTPSTLSADARNRVGRVTVELGWRGVFVPSSAFDAFSNKRLLNSATMAGSYTFLERGRLTLAAGLRWEPGSSESVVRETPSKLVSNRLGLHLDARYEVWPWLRVYGRGAPTLTALYARLSDPFTDASTESSKWLFGVDLSAGFIVGIPTGFRPIERALRVGLSIDGGYSFTTPTTISMGPEGASPTGPSLGELKLSGPFMRVSLAATF